ncbi:MAG: mechanosensitive ion channel family protein [Selenomonadaceae bacterium]|nr:mechanosensitive ion channel family protein [Selenomonadaceae bacterium]
MVSTPSRLIYQLLKIFQEEELYLNYFQHIDWWALGQKLIIPACILVFAFFVGVAINHLLTQKLARHVKASESELMEIFFRAMKGVPISLCMVIGLYWCVTTSELPAGLEKIFSYILFTMIIFSITQVCERTLSGFIRMKFSETSDITQSTLLDTIFRIAIYASGALIIMDYVGISIAPVMATLGLGSMAIGLGLKETLENIFSGLQILISKQFRVNDYIRLSTGDEGRVIDINWRYITVMPPSKSNVVVIPNKVIASSVTTNFSQPRDDIVLTVPIGVGYESDLEHVENVTVEVARELQIRIDGYKPMFDAQGNDTNPLAPVVRYQKFNDSSIDFNAVLHVQTFTNQYILKHEFIKAITKRYREEGINIPFPIRTLDFPEDKKVDLRK